MKSYVKNHNLGFEVPYRYGSENRRYRPDFIVLVDDGRGATDLLHLIVEIKGYRREDAKEKKNSIETYWVPGVNNSGRYGRWAFAELTEVYQIESDFEAKVRTEFNRMIEDAAAIKVRNVEWADVVIQRELPADSRWKRLSSAIWGSIENDATHAFALSRLPEVARVAGCEIKDALSLLALLSQNEIGLLRMEFWSGDNEVAYDDFARMLNAWWKAKTISHADWKAWASNVRVRWVSTDLVETPK